MKLLALAATSTGDDPKTGCILEVAAVLFDPQPDLHETTPKQRRWATWDCIITNSYIQGSPSRLADNMEVIEEIAGTFPGYRQRLAPSQVVPKIREWLVSNDVSSDAPVTVAGDSYDRFDRPHLLRLPGWTTMIESSLRPAVLDVGSLCFRPDDGRLQGLEECLDVIGVTCGALSRAEERALHIATLVSRFFT